jgi:hypothetical protein
MKTRVKFITAVTIGEQRYQPGQVGEVEDRMAQALILAGSAEATDGRPPERRFRDRDGHHIRAFGVGPCPVYPPAYRPRRGENPRFPNSRRQG